MPPGSWPPVNFPRLNSHNCHETSPPTNLYNCIAWAAGNDARWWWPDSANIGYWPPNVPREETIEAFILAYATEGYSPCPDAAVEVGVDKVAIYAVRVGQGIYPTHAARQLEDGRWTSKLGTCEDIEHDTLEALNGPLYGSPICFLRRAHKL